MGCHSLFPGDHPELRIEPGSPALWADSLCLSHQHPPICSHTWGLRTDTWEFLHLQTSERISGKASTPAGPPLASASPFTHPHPSASPRPTDPEVARLRELAGGLAMGHLHRVLNEQQHTHDLGAEQSISEPESAQPHHQPFTPQQCAVRACKERSWRRWNAGQ